MDGEAIHKVVLVVPHHLAVIPAPRRRQPHPLISSLMDGEAIQEIRGMVLQLGGPTPARTLLFALLLVFSF